MGGALWAPAMRLRSLAMLCALTVAGSAPAQTWVQERVAARPVARGAGLLRQAMLAGHNAARSDFGSAPIVWDKRLAEDARDYARVLAATGRFRHSTGRRGAEPQGENLWTGTRGAYAYEEMIGAWIAERRDFRPGIVPAVSRTGRFEDVGHYVQIVWPATTRVGCATASDATRDYLVCRYAAPGNVVGRPVG
jgi:uncharacterized protein YkwD